MCLDKLFFYFLTQLEWVVPMCHFQRTEFPYSEQAFKIPTDYAADQISPKHLSYMILNRPVSRMKQLTRQKSVEFNLFENSFIYIGKNKFQYKRIV